jgi:hypothetical protein
MSTLQLNRMQRANRAAHDRRMREVRFLLLVGGCFLAVVCLLAHMVTYNIGGM